MTDEKSSNSSKIEPKIYKEEEFNLMLEMVRSGLWKNVNLVTALHIDEKTIIEWKKRPEVIEAHRSAILKFIKRVDDPEKLLRELGLDIEQDKALFENKILILPSEIIQKYELNEPSPDPKDSSTG